MKTWKVPEIILLVVAVAVAIFLLTCCGGDQGRPSESYGWPPTPDERTARTYPDDGSSEEADSVYADDGKIEEAEEPCLAAVAADCGYRVEGVWNIEAGCCEGSGCLVGVVAADCGYNVEGVWDPDLGCCVEPQS